MGLWLTGWGSGVWRGRPCFSILGKTRLADYALPPSGLRAKLRRPATPLTPNPSGTMVAGHGSKRWVFILGGEDFLPSYGGDIASTRRMFA